MNKIRNYREEVLSKTWSVLKRCSYEFQRDDGTWEPQVREAYDRGHGATVLLYHQLRRSVVLTKQFRLPVFLDDRDGFMIEACAGKLEEADPKACVIRETLEETGYLIADATKVFELFMSPGSVTEKIHFYIALVDDSMKVSRGGGVESECENISVIEVPVDEALAMVSSGKIRDAKTVVLLQYLAMRGYP